MFTSYGAKHKVLFDVCVDIVIALGLEWGASGEDGVEGGEVVCLLGMDATVLQGPQPFGPSPKNGDPAVKHANDQYHFRADTEQS